MPRRAKNFGPLKSKCLNKTSLSRRIHSPTECMTAVQLGECCVAGGPRDQKRMRSGKLGACVSEGQSPVRIFPAPLWVTVSTLRFPSHTFGIANYTRPALVLGNRAVKVCAAPARDALQPGLVADDEPRTSIIDQLFVSQRLRDACHAWTMYTEHSCDMFMCELEFIPAATFMKRQ